MKLLGIPADGGDVCRHQSLRSPSKLLQPPAAAQHEAMIPLDCFPPRAKSSVRTIASALGSQLPHQPDQDLLPCTESWASPAQCSLSYLFFCRCVICVALEALPVFFSSFLFIFSKCLVGLFPSYCPLLLKDWKLWNYTLLLKKFCVFQLCLCSSYNVLVSFYWSKSYLTIKRQSQSLKCLIYPFRNLSSLWTFIKMYFIMSPPVQYLILPLDSSLLMVGTMSYLSS